MQKYFLIQIFLFFLIFSACTRKAFKSKVEKAIVTTVSPLKDTVMLGEPVLLEFNIHNKLEKDLYYFGNGREVYPQYYYIMLEGVREDSDKKYKRRDGIGLGLGPVGYKQIPKNEGLTDFICVNDWFELDTIGTFIISLNRSLIISKKDSNNKLGSRIKRNHQVKVVVIPKDDEKFGNLIDTLGKHTSQGDYYKAHRILSHIKDERVITHYLDDWKTTNPCIINRASLGERVRILNKFKRNKEVYQFYKELTQISPDSPSICTTEHMKNYLACNIRETAIRGLESHENPNTFEYLLSLRNDTLCIKEKFSDFHGTLLHALYKLDAKRPLPILKEYVNHEDEKVRNLVSRYINEIEAN